MEKQGKKPPTSLMVRGLTFKVATVSSDTAYISDEASHSTNWQQPTQDGEAEDRVTINRKHRAIGNLVVVDQLSNRDSIEKDPQPKRDTTAMNNLGIRASSVVDTLAIGLVMSTTDESGFLFWKHWYHGKLTGPLPSSGSIHGEILGTESTSRWRVPYRFQPTTVNGSSSSLKLKKPKREP